MLKTMIRITGLCAATAALAMAFFLLTPTPALAGTDEQTVVKLSTDDGVVSVTMADYLPLAVAAEMPVSFGPEALKAQAVAARTYVLSARRHDAADVCTDSGCCLAYRTRDELRALWGDAYEENLTAVTEAVTATDGQILTYGGEPIQAVFHASSWGSTASSGSVWGALPYLTGVPTPETPESVPGLMSEARFTPAELCARLSIAPEGEPEAWITPPVSDESGRVASVTIGGTVFSGAAVRAALGLKSTAFTARFEDGCFVFTAAGSGHGVGMSQYGAKLLAADGWTYDAILLYYYPGATLRR